MLGAIAVSFCASVLAASVDCTTSAGLDDAIFLDLGLLVVNSTEATWRYSADGDEDHLVEILRGELEDRVYDDGNDNLWPYRVAVFKHNGSLVLRGRLQVFFIGQPAVSIESTHGNIEIDARLMLDGYINLGSETGSLGGYGDNLGPGGGGFLNDATLPYKPPGGAGHGGTGGEAFTVREGAFDPSTGGFVFEEKRYGYPYLIGNGHHLLGGSAGGKAEYDPTVLVFPNSRGGGALEVTAKQKITIGGYISATGQSGIPYDTAFIDRYTVEPCAGGGSGGLIRLRAPEIEVLLGGFLSVAGGDGAQNTDTGVYCGGGGAGGLIEFHISDRAHGRLGSAILLDGGKGTIVGGAGRLEVTTSNVTGDCAGNPLPLSTEPPSPTRPADPRPAPATSCTATDLPPCDCEAEAVTRATSVTACDCGDAVTCPTVSDTTECDCGQTGCQTGPEMVTCSCNDDSEWGVTVMDDPTTNVTKPLTPDVAVKVLEESLNVIGSLGDNSIKEGAVTLLMAVETLGLNLGKQLAEGLQTGEVITVATGTETIGMQVIVADNASAFNRFVFPDPTDPAFDTDRWRAPSVLLEVTSFIPKEISSYVIIVNVLYTNISESLDDSSMAVGLIRTVNSRVVGTTVYFSDNITADFNISVCLTAEKLQKNVSGISICVFWDFQASSPGAWSTVGCWLRSENETHAVCACDHLTNFAILLKPDHVTLTSRDEFALGVMSNIGLGLSLCALLLAFLTLSVSLKSLKNFSSAVIHLNLIVSLGIADSLFLIGADDTEDKMRCTVIAITLHYFYLATFMWMLCEGFHIYIRVTSVFTDVRGHLKFYFLASWGIPAVVVGVTAGVNPQGYGGEKACWLDTAGNMLWAFACPVGLIIAINTIFLVLILYRFLTVKSIAKKSKYEQLKKATRASFVLLPLLGTTWIFGLAAFGSGSVALFYAFVAFNSLQGVLICIFHCLTNDDVASTLRIKLRKSRTRIDIFLTSTERKSQQKSVKTPGRQRKDRDENDPTELTSGRSASGDGSRFSGWATLASTSQNNPS